MSCSNICFILIVIKFTICMQIMGIDSIYSIVLNSTHNIFKVKWNKIKWNKIKYKNDKRKITKINEKKEETEMNNYDIIMDIAKS